MLKKSTLLSFNVLFALSFQRPQTLYCMIIFTASEWGIPWIRRWSEPGHSFREAIKRKMLLGNNSSYLQNIHGSLQENVFPQ